MMYNAKANVRWDSKRPKNSQRCCEDLCFQGNEMEFLLSFVLLDAVDHPGQLLSDGRPRQSDSFTMIPLLHPNDDDIVACCWFKDLPTMYFLHVGQQLTCILGFSYFFWLMSTIGNWHVQGAVKLHQSMWKFNFADFGLGKIHRMFGHSNLGIRNADALQWELEIKVARVEPLASSGTAHRLGDHHCTAKS